MKSPFEELLMKLVQGPLILLVVLYYGWQYYQIEYSDSSVMSQKRAEVKKLKAEVTALETKAKAAEEFRASLDAKRAQLYDYARRLNDAKVTIPESVDVAEFMRTVIAEAKRAGLTVLALEPSSMIQQEHYAFQPFRLSFRGVYVQVIVFLDRLSKIQNLVRLEGLTMRPISFNSGKYVDLEGRIELGTFKYTVSSADQIAMQTSGQKFNGGDQ